MATYTAWPVLADVDLKLASAGITLRAGATTAYKQTVLDAVTAETERRCRRTFAASTTVRFFDGTGTPELEVDEVVVVTAVALVNDAGSTIYTYPTTVWHLVSRQQRAVTRIRLARGAGVRGPVFPVGRDNVKVTGSWCYEAAIPRDLWDAVAGEAAARLADEGLFSPTGRLDFTAAAGNSARYNFGIPGGAAGTTWPGERNASNPVDWHRQYERMIKVYRAPLGRRLRALKGGMV